MGRKIKQVYFSEITEQELIDKAEKVPNFSKYIKDLMVRECFMDDIRSILQMPAQSDHKPQIEVLNQFI